MKRILFVILLFFTIIVSSSPGRVEMWIVIPKAINQHEAIWKAICQYESKNYPMAYNKRENAVGIAQIRPIRIKDYNQRTGKTYQLNEMYDTSKSKEVFMYYASKLQNPDKIIRKWNGSGPKTYEYLKKIKQIMETNS
jgi:hypothetical protein